MSRSTLPLALAATLLACPALAHKEGHRQAGAHVHGLASLSVALDGNTLSVELESPLDSLVGFEHAPKNDAERKALDGAVATLKDPAKVIALPAAAGCKTGEADIHLPDSFGPGGHAHDDGHKHDAKDGHDHGHGHGHADLTASYSFTCATPSALDKAELALFKAFPRMEKVEATVLAGTAQKAASLTPKRASLDLR